MPFQKIIANVRVIAGSWFSRERIFETLACFGLLTLFGQVIFLEWFESSVGLVARGYWMFLFVTWAAVRYGKVGVVLAVGITSIQALSGAVLGLGFFEKDIQQTHLTNFFVYISVLSGVGLSLASVVAKMQEAQDEMRLAALVFQHSNEAMSVTDANGIILTVNRAFSEITGYSSEEIVGKTHKVLQSGRQDKAFYDSMWQAINTTGSWQGEIWNRRKDGSIYPEWLVINTIFNNDGSINRRIGLFSDITEKKKSEQVIWKQANYDQLTELPNRHMFYDRLELEIKKSHRANLPLALMYLDLDHFKDVNDSLGHAMGDDLLKESTSRLCSCVRETDTVARLGGDEFIIIMGALDDIGSVERVAEDILHKMSEPFRLEGELTYITASIGITFYPEDATSVDELLKNADQAMYAAKSDGRNNFHYFTPFMQEAAKVRNQLSRDLHHALANNEFRVHYQPIVDLKSGTIHKAEALVRWQHPINGLISPMAFIPIAEETGLINEIGDWVFVQSTQQSLKWREQIPSFQVSVNKSPIQFRNKRNHQDWLNHLQLLGVTEGAGPSVVVEITEGLLADDSLNAKLLVFRDSGIQVSLDDFGTGYSSLSYLKKFDIDYLKIDQSFVRHLSPNSNDMALCEAIIVMAHKLGIKVIAEGVETEEQRDLLTAAGCDYGQGYLWSKPVPADEFEKLILK